MFRGTLGFFIIYLLFSSTLATTDEDDSCGLMEALPYIAVGGGAAILGGPAVLGVLGFTGKGIAAKSIGALIMKITATLNGGGVAAGGLVSFLQSLGAKAGISTLGLAGAKGGYYFHNFFVCGKNKKSTKKN
ncbi:interferon alpha-inducible protein 27-like protein 2A [Heptranchias perlo]|uniref:interferon alpha-inducible protein 27-like protein 2A n=1 Tax=Heptranchias perlo TaxID=212740 RepID=UPI00355A53F0